MSLDNKLRRNPYRINPMKVQIEPNTVKAVFNNALVEPVRLKVESRRLGVSRNWKGPAAPVIGQKSRQASVPPGEENPARQAVPPRQASRQARKSRQASAPPG